MTLRQRLGLKLLGLRHPEEREHLVFEYRRTPWIGPLGRFAEPGESAEDLLSSAMRVVTFPKGWKQPASTPKGWNPPVST